MTADEQPKGDPEREGEAASCGDDPEPSRPPRVAAYLLACDEDDAKAASLREKLASLQRSLGTPLGTYAEKCQDRRRRPLRARLLRRGSRHTG